VSTHEPFAQPTIVEALCEVHFGLGDGREWNEEWFGAFFRKIEASFPRMEPRQLMKLSPAEGGIGLRGVQQVLGMVYHHRDRPLLRQLFQDHLTVNELAPYPGWGVFLDDLAAAWSDFAQVVDPAHVTRIGLRYINRIPRASTGETLGDWLADSEYYPRLLRDGTSGFRSRFEHRPQPGVRLVVTVAEEKVDSGTGPVILDLDAIIEASMPSEMPALKSELDALHDVIWTAFESTLTERLRAHLRGGIR
jgi:uncharacterized protein (TIGR04255 family)